MAKDLFRKMLFSKSVNGAQANPELPRQLNMDVLSQVSGGELDEDTKLNLCFEVSMGKGSGYSREHFQQIISEYYTPEEVEYCMKLWDMDVWA